jgi:hypothetical protein
VSLFAIKSTVVDISFPFITSATGLEKKEGNIFCNTSMLLLKTLNNPDLLVPEQMNNN